MLPNKFLGAVIALALVLFTGSSGVDGLSCLKCKGGCEVAASSTCPSGETHCFTKYDERVSVIEMGCRSDYAEEQILKDFKDFFFCEGDDCNDYENIPDDGQCAVCNSDSMNMCVANPARLPNYRCSKAPHKDCYSRLTSTGAVERGCVSNLNPETFKNCYLGTDKSCLVCSEPGCNKNVISTNIACFTCKDSDDCEIPNSKTCDQETSGCFTRFDEQSDIAEMGCKGVYSEEHVLNNLKTFYECEGNNCNDLNNLPNNNECKQCNSASDKNCIDDVFEISSTLCIKPPHTSCYSRLTEENTVVRGCAADLNDAHFKDCVLKTDKNCFICNEPSCNTDSIKPADVPEDLVGVWQELPVNCYHCVGDDCKADGNWLLKSCSSNRFQTCTTVFGSSGEVSERGCSDTVKDSQGDYCAANPEKCVKCKSNGCNDFTDSSSLVECLSCDVSGDCTKTTQCNGKCMVAINPLTNATYRGCLNDKEFDDRDDCGKDGTCRACEGAKCNDFDLEPIGGFSCNVCKGNDCDAPVSKVCDNQVEGDKCFMKFDESASVVEMGCTSQIDEVELLKNYKDYYICDEESCNKFENLPLDGQCVDCDSKKNETCATDPSTFKTRRCGLLPHTGCYARINSEGHTIRGCLSNLERDLFADCVLGKDGKCKTCDQSEGCNREEIPENRLKCHRCSSFNKSECESNGVNLEVCPVFVEGDVCVSKYENGLTSRGCGFEVTCGPGETEDTCRSCEGNGCNDVNLAVLHGNDGILGLWQDLPVNCEHCKGDNCGDESKWILRACSSNKYQTCSTVFGSSGEVVERGCSDTVKASQSEYCAANPSKCVNCKSNACNNFKEQSDLVECYTCDVKGECETNTVQCAGECMVAKNPLTGETYRGCLNDKDLDDREECNKDQTCRTCKTPKCNDFNLEPIPSTGSKCNFCPGNDCVTIVPKDCNGVGIIDQCYTLVDDEKSVVSMGCKSELEVPFIDEHLRAKELYFCEGDLCNSYERLTETKNCLSCNSLTNPECATFGLETTTQCRSLPYYECYKRVLPNGHTERGCLSNLEEDDFLSCLNNDSELCQSCLGDQCNEGLVPKDRLECYKCDSNNDPKCATASTSTAACVTHVANDVCVSKFSEDGSVVRGCQSDVACEASDNCKTCKGNNCNNDVSIPSTGFSCNACVDDCQTFAKKQCSNSTESACFIRFDEEQSIIDMGCRGDLDEEEVEDNLNKFIFCEKENCNDYSLVLPNQCIVCNSNEDQDCALHPVRLTDSKSCTNLANTKCYTRVTELGDTERGCVGELDLENYKNCLGGLLCEVCDGQNCNKQPYPEDRLECLVCNSALDNNCLLGTASRETCPVFNKNQVCVSKVTSENTVVRGCSEQVKCENDSIYDCELCTSNSCNQGKLLNLRSVGAPGAWQELPLTCLTCEGDDCATSSNSNTCENNPQQNCVTVFNGENVVSRGCADNVYEKYIDHCRNYPGSCHECKSNNCNTLSSKSALITCATCESSNDPNCAENVDQISTTRQCNGKCMTALHPLSNDANPAYEIVRSCLDDKEPEAQACDDDKCKACEGSNCNNHVFELQILSCNHCVDDCEEYESKKCSAYKEKDQCFMRFDETSSVVEMGCASKFTTEELDNGARDLFLCDGDNCNDYPALPKVNYCVSCNSNDNEECATNPVNVSTISGCGTPPHTSCFSRVNSDGSTQRGCLMRLPADDFNACHKNSSSCNSCEGLYCNNEVFPADRHQCHRCDSSSDENCKSNPNSLSACPVYNKNEQCVSALDGETLIRGCASEISCTGRVCKKCSGHGCNTEDIKVPNEGFPGLWQDVPLNCYKCEGAKCENNQETLSTCNAANAYQNCITIFGDNGKVAKRGCSDEVESDCSANPEKCLVCKSSGCNNAVQQSDYVDCLFCDSKNDPNCRNQPALIGNTRKCHKQCMVSLYKTSSSFAVVRSCLDDKDLDDRETCQGGTDLNCEACTGARCNTAVLPKDNRLSCLTCEGDDCEIAESELCPENKEDDQCFLRFEENEVVQMGCISLFDKELDEILKSKQVLVCEGENCNKQLLNTIPTAQSCQSCNSTNEIDCAINPISLGNLESCSHLPYPQCYVKIGSNGNTERGCLSSLEGDEFLTCLNNSNPLCSSCTGGNCNNKVFPEARLRCHQCNSGTDPSCGKDIQGNICPIYDQNDSCVSSWIEGVTYRGCGSQLKCDESDSGKCKVCKTNHCNTHELEGDPEPEPEIPVGVGEPGLWQDLPLNCYKCEGSDCGERITLSKCENNNLQVCTTVFGLSGSVEKRDCSDKVEVTHSQYCKANPDKCISCKSNGCNIENALEDHIDCVFCDSENDANCALGSTNVTRKCHKSCMTALYPLSLTDPNPSYALSRSCLDDKEIDDRDTCQGTLCNKCSSENCNDQKYPETRLSCHRCNGDDCDIPTSQICSRYRANDVCFTVVDSSNSVIQKGCGSDILSPYIDELLKTKKMYTCEGDNCNAYENLPQPEFCSLCNSKTDPFCATNPLNVASKTKCEVQGYNQCYSRVLADGHTERGCLSSLEGDEFLGCLKNESSTCQACVGDTCNQEVYPENRPSCHVCSSDANGSCTSSPDSSSVCLLYSTNQFCYSSLNGSVTSRGCGDETKCTNEKCNTCRGHDCNTIDFTGDSEIQDDVFGRFQALPLNCYVCKENCSSTLGVLETCQGRLRQDCITVFGEDGNVTARGCSDQVRNTQNTYCNANPEKCFTCKSNECNVAWDTSDYVDCISCDSRKDVSCIDKAESFSTKKCHKTCVNTLFPSVEKLQYDVHRGCLDDKDVLDQMLCNGDGKSCEPCTGPSCNKNVFPANRLQCHRCSPSDASCATKPTNIQYCPTYTSDDTCVTYFNGGSVSRGCSSENICDSGDVQCQQCSGNGCNDKTEFITPTPTLTPPTSTTPPTPPTEGTPKPTGEGCFKCSGDDCELPTASKCVADFDQCYIKFEGVFEIKEMGCKAEYSNPSEIDDLIKKKQFYVCDGTNCNDLNSFETKQCTVCNSQSDESCATNPAILFGLPSKTCGVPYSQCYSRVLSNGHTERGCLEDLVDDEFLECLGNNSEKCSSCQGDNCNKNVYPENRLSCDTCQGNCDQANVNTQVCLLYQQEKCFARYNDVGTPIRLGCSSSVSSTDLQEWENNNVLHECTGKSCNALNKLPQNEKCLVCDSTTDERCATAPVILRGLLEETCYAPNNKCYTQVKGTTTFRGCLKDAGTQTEINNCENNVGLCQACSGGQCNDKIYPENRLSCHRCNSKDNEECAKEQTSTEHNYCPFYVASDKCVARYNRDERFTERDCASTNDFTCDANDTKACQICEGSLCNTAEVSGAATIIASVTVLLLGLIINLHM